MSGLADDERDALGRFNRSNRVPPGPHLQKEKKRKNTYFKHFKVDELLPDEHKAAYEKLMRDPRTTVPILQAFLRGLGVNISRNAVASHRTNAHLDVKRTREMSLMAQAFCELTRQRGASTVAEASHAKFEMKLMEFLFREPDAPLMEAEQLERIGKVTRLAVQTRKEVETLREDCERRDHAAAKASAPRKSQREISLETVRRVDEILGIRRPQEATPEARTPGTPSSP